MPLHACAPPAGGHIESPEEKAGKQRAAEAAEAAVEALQLRGQLPPLATAEAIKTAKEAAGPPPTPLDA
jgi:hypothetical protein